MKQIEQSMAMFRKSCTEKTGVEASLIDGLHKGNWPEDDKKLKVIFVLVFIRLSFEKYFAGILNFFLFLFLFIVFYAVHR